MKKRMKRVTALVLTVGLVAGLLAGCGGSTKGNTESGGETGSATKEASGAPEYTLIFSVDDPETNPQCQNIYKPLAEKIEEVTDGRVAVEMHYNGEIVNAGTAFEALQQGTVDIVFTANSIDSTAHPLDLLIESSSFTSECQRRSQVYNELMDEHEKFASEYDGYKCLALINMYDGFIGTTKKQITKPEDLKGLNIMVTSSLMADRVTAFGATPVFGAPNEEYSSLEKGVVDGLFYSVWTSMYTNSWADVIDYATVGCTNNSVNGIFMSQDTWDRLPADIQEQIDSIRPWLIETIDKTYVEYAYEAQKSLKEDGKVEIYYMSDEEKEAFQQIQQAAVDAYIEKLDAEGWDATGFYEKYQELTDKYSDESYNIVNFDE